MPSQPPLTASEHFITVGPYEIRVERRSARKVFGRVRRESLRLHIERDGSLKITAPPRLPVETIRLFALENLNWIETQRAKTLLQAANRPIKKLQEGEKFRFFGRERELLLAEPLLGEKARRGLTSEVFENHIVLYLPSDERTSENIKKSLAKLYESEARLHLPERVDHFSREMGVKPSGLSFRSQKTRWGSCSPSGHISLNWKVIFAPEAVIDYLVVHELAHLVHANHSESFWSLVAKHDPECRENRRWLRNHQWETTIFDR